MRALIRVRLRFATGFSSRFASSFASHFASGRLARTAIAPRTRDRAAPAPLKSMSARKVGS
jgi:hypothetical protein